MHPYSKWDGAHWRLVSLVELEAAADERLIAAANAVLAWLTGDRHRASIKTIDGLPRVHASQEGNALAVCSRLGMAGDPRVARLARDLVAWQWPDGGWNCDPKAGGRRSSFHESLIPAYGLHEYAVATGDEDARRRRAGQPSCCSITGSSVARTPASRSTPTGCDCTTRRSGTTTSCTRC